MSAFLRWSAVIQVIVIVVLLVQQVSWSSDSSVPSSGKQYEIPLSDLKKVEKKKPRKSEGRRHKEHKRTSKKTEIAVPETPRAVATEPEVSVQAMPSSGIKELPTPEAHSDGTPTVDLTPALADGARITHEPYSYVVTGKRTIIKAIISSRFVFQSVRCQFRSSEESGSALVPMIKAEGSHYTYTATIPALAQGTNFLRYQFVVIDTLGKETRSREFVMPTNQTSVVPGWQQEPSQEAIKLDLATPGKPLEGFSDVIIENTSQAIISTPQPLKNISPIPQTTP